MLVKNIVIKKKQFDEEIMLKYSLLLSRVASKTNTAPREMATLAAAPTRKTTRKFESHGKVNLLGDILIR